MNNNQESPKQVVTADHFGIIHAVSRNLFYVAFVFLLSRLVSVFFIAFTRQEQWAISFWKDWLPYIQFQADPIDFSRMNLQALILSVTIVLVFYLYHALWADGLRPSRWPRTIAWYLAIWMGVLEFGFTYFLELTPQFVITELELGIMGAYVGLATFVFVIIYKKRSTRYKDYVSELDMPEEPTEQESKSTKNSSTNKKKTQKTTAKKESK